MKITLKNLRFHAFHGCLPQERTVGNDYVVEINVETADSAAAIEEDKLDGTVNYADIFAIVREEMQRPSNLLEHVCGRILTRLLGEFSLIKTATVRLEKINPPIGADSATACVELTRSRR